MSSVSLINLFDWIADCWMNNAQFQKANEWIQTSINQFQFGLISEIKLQQTDWLIDWFEWMVQQQTGLILASIKPKCINSEIGVKNKGRIELHFVEVWLN